MKLLQLAAGFAAAAVLCAVAAYAALEFCGDGHHPCHGTTMPLATQIGVR